MISALPFDKTTTRHARAIQHLAIAAVLLGLLSSATAGAQNFQVIHTFTDGSDGAIPFVGLTMDRAGSLYGTAYVAFKIKHSGNGWILTPLYPLNVVAGSLTFGPNGTLYGAMPQGGLYEGTCWETGCGTVLNLQPQPAACASVFCTWNEHTLYEFTQGADYYSPNSPIIFDAAGNIYGTAANNVFKLTRSGNSYTFSNIYNFANGGGQYPLSGPVMDAAGNLYGTTSTGGANGKGVVYELTPNGSGWTESVIYSFRGQEDGQFVVGSLAFDRSGNLYGTTAAGGSGNGGTVFELARSANGWTYNLLYSFTAGGQNGFGGPNAALAIDAAGDLYGTTDSDGAFGFGSAFKLTPGQNGWTYTDLHDFTGGDDGNMWYSAVTPVVDASGNIYGTAANGGADDYGTVWTITP